MPAHPSDTPPPLLERTGELALLFSLAADVAEGQSRIALLTGEGGIGKTRLAEEFAASLPPAWRVDGLEGQRLVVIEDLHDREPADVDVAVVRAADQPGTLVLATCQLEGVAPGTERAGALLRVLRDPRAVEVHLTSLRPASVLELAAALGAELDAEAAELLVHRSGGNPFYVVELLRSRDQDVPWSVAASVADRLDRIGGPAHDTMRVLALWGGPAPEAQVRQVVPDAPVPRLTRAELVRRADDLLALRHDVVGEVVLEDLTAAARAELHRRISEVLAGSPDADPAALTRHLEAAGDRRAAARTAWPAATASARGRYFVRATRLFELALGETLDERSGEELEGAALAAAAAGRIDLAERWARAAEAAYRRDGDAHRAAAMWLGHGLRYVHRPEVQAVDLDPDTAPRLAVEATDAARSGRHAEAAEVARKAIDLARRGDDSDAGAQAAVALMLAGEPGEARLALESNRQAAITAAEPQREGRRSAELARVAFAVGDAGLAEAHQRAAVAACARVPEGGDEPFMRLGLAASLAVIGRLDEAEALAVPFVDDERLVVSLMAHAPLSIVDLARGDLVSAQDRLAVMQPYRELAGPDAFGTALSDGARVAMLTHDLDRATAALADAEEWIGGRFEPTRPDRLETAVRAAVLRGDADVVVRLVDEITDLAHDPAAGVGLIALSEWGRGHIALLRGRPQVAQARLVSGARLFEKAPRLVQSADAWCDAAVAGLRLGDPAAVAEALGHAERLAVAGGYGLVRTRIETIAAAVASTEPVDADVARLTPRERSILEHLVEGSTNKEIAAALHLSEKTVRNQLSLLFAKLGFERRSQAAAFAARHGLGTVPPRARDAPP